YRQSERKELYLTFAKILVSEGKAFPCFCDAAENKEEIFERRENLLEENSELEEKDICRNLTFEEIEKNILAKKPFALRLKSSGKSGDRIKFVDEVRGERETDANAKDVVLIKSNGIPPYCFAHAIDDHFMRTTVVVRGEEWLSTLPQHLEIFDALGFDRVRYIHTPLICKISDNGNKRKISKRLDPEADMRFYLKEGFTTESVLEYLLNLANSNFEIWRKENPTEPNSKFKFSIEKIGTSSPMFDIVKLCDISKNLISTLSAEEVFEKVLAWADEFDLPFAKELKERKDYSIKVFSIDRYNAKPRKDIAKWSDVQLFLGFMFKCYNKLNCLYDFEIDGFREDIVMQFLKAYLEVFDLDDEKDVWFDKIKSLAGQLGFAVDNKEYKQNPAAFNGNVADACTFVRLALTGRRNSPDIYAIMKVLGKEEIAKRINNLIDLLK
ncbi:MAG: glutamate--tRNA ligase family protein, partial [Clostridia bacterium]